jgi:ubiquinone/menaquinone biosynthesis C-methylase UbiE
MPSLKHMIKSSADAILAPFGCELTRKQTNGAPDPKADQFPIYLLEANRLGMDVNDYEEQKMGWSDALPILEATVFPYLRSDSIVCNLGVGTGRWARHIVKKVPKGELHLVDHSPWMTNFLHGYFQANPNIHIHLNDGYSFPFPQGWCVDFVVSCGTFIALKLGHIYLYSREFFKVLKPGGYCMIEYIDVTREEGWKRLESQSNRQFASCYTYYTPEVLERVFSSAGFEIVKLHHMSASAFLVAKKPASAGLPAA